jgi:DNA-binding MarR family transcriptional regulator
MKQSPCSIDPLTGSLLYSLLAIAQRYLARLEAELRVIGLSPTLYETLEQLAHAERPLSLRVLAEGQHCAPSNITQKMDRLEREGLVRRIEDPSDRRVVLAEITPSGKEKTRSGEQIVERLEAEFESAIPEGDRAAFIRVLGALQ